MTRKVAKAKEPTKEAPTTKAVRDRFAGFEAVAAKMKNWRPAAQVLRPVLAVPTCFPQVDLGTRCGGWPIERICTIHGPSNHGKTAFSHGLGLSFLRAGHFYAFVDAEFTTPEPWLRELMGEQATNPAFVAMRPDSFEQTVDAVRDFLLKIAEAREAGDVEPDTSAIIVIDSARKLIPENLLAKIAKEGASGKKGSVDGMSGRAGQHKAAMMSQWLDEMVPLLAKTRANMTVIAREADDPTADMNDMIYDNAWKIAGSKSLVYEASLVVRVTRDGWVYDPPKGEDRVIVGERHQARIWKTKVGGKEDKHTDCYFHTSNGVDGNVGFDPARDLFDLGRQLGLIDVAGSWFSFGKKKLGQGEGKSVQKLRADEGLRGELQAEVSKIDEGRRSAAPKEDA